ncbi:MAG: invasion associated locus B family protein [Methylobacteriaceae bacterium]|nr:invasion associated locus B family protein [Methylobacteriaceae bacterium]
MSAAVSAGEAASTGQERRFGPWLLTCTGDACRLSQRLAVETNKEVVFALTIVPGEKKTEPVGIVSFPLGGYIAPGVELRVDDRKAYKILVETCNASGCHAGFSFTPALLREFQRGREASFRLWTDKAKSVDIAVSLEAFTAAMKAFQDGIQ